MANQLLDAIALGTDLGKPLVWLDAEAFGSRVVLNGKPLPWHNPTQFVAAYGQLQGLLKAQVAPVHLGRFLRSWLQENPSALREMSGKKRVRFAIKRLLGMDAQRQMIRDIVSALCESRSEPVVLVLPPNAELINWANDKANGSGPVELSDIDIDTVSVYLADFLRSFSGLNVAGVLVELAEDAHLNADLLELYSPIINVCQHYRWAIGMSVSAGQLQEPGDRLQFVVSDQATAGVTGLVQGDSMWQGQAVNWQQPHFIYAAVPAAMEPERVLERLAEVRN